MAVNPEKNGVNQGFITKLIGIVKRKVLDLSGAVSDEETRAMAAEASARTEVVQGENCTIEKTTASDGHDVYTINADGKPQVQADWSQADSSKVDYIKNKPDLSLKEDVANKATTVRQSGSADDTHFPSEAAVRSAIDSAVSAAYKAAGTKRAAELTSSLLVAANEGNVYNITEAGTTDNNFVDGAGKTINVGDNVGVCKVGNDYKFDLLSGFLDLSDYVQKSDTAGLLKNDGTVDTSDYLTKTGDGSNVTITPDGSTGTTFSSGGKLSALAQKFINLVSSLKALAFKDTASYNDLSSGVQSSLDKADTALQEHQDISGKEDVSNKVTSWSQSQPSDDYYPSEKLVKDYVDAGASEMGEVVAAALNDLDARIRANEEAVSETNLGDRTADRLDVQTLLVGGEDVAEKLESKVDKVEGKGLSTNDFTDTYKGNVDANTSARHTHSNKTLLDNISQSDIDNWNSKQSALSFMTDAEVDALFTAAWNAANA